MGDIIQDHPGGPDISTRVLVRGQRQGRRCEDRCKEGGGESLEEAALQALRMEEEGKVPSRRKGKRTNFFPEVPEGTQPCGPFGDFCPSGQLEIVLTWFKPQKLCRFAVAATGNECTSLFFSQHSSLLTQVGFTHLS